VGKATGTGKKYRTLNHQFSYMELLLPGVGLIFWTLVAFIIVFVILRKFAWKPILSSLNERERTIAGSLETAERVKREMAQLKSENEELMARAREERSAMLKEARETKDRIINEAKEQAKVEANKIIIDAQQQINAQKMAALTDVKNQVGKLVVEVTEKVLRKQLDNPGAQEAHIQGLVNEVKLN
jgi:F-type H+-transporting ATPase subunit b